MALPTAFEPGYTLKRTMTSSMGANYRLLLDDWELNFDEEVPQST
jgi:hypothetical protein